MVGDRRKAGLRNYEDQVTVSRTVTVTATDSTGAPTDPPATVTINVIDVDEKPKFATASAPLLEFLTPPAW